MRSRVFQRIPIDPLRLDPDVLPVHRPSPAIMSILGINQIKGRSYPLLEIELNPGNLSFHPASNPQRGPASHGPDGASPENHVRVGTEEGDFPGTLQLPVKHHLHLSGRADHQVCIRMPEAGQQKCSYL